MFCQYASSRPTEAEPTTVLAGWLRSVKAMLVTNRVITAREKIAFQPTRRILLESLSPRSNRYPPDGGG
jgi:hypothetical protein